MAAVPYIFAKPYLDANFSYLTANAIFPTGSPAAGNLAQFSGPTTITNGNLSGDITTSGSLVTTLATVNANVGTFGSTTQVPQFTVNAKGLITAAANITPATSLKFTQTQSVTVANTVTETTLIGTGVGSLAIAANSMQVGTTFSGLAIGPHSASGNPTIRIRVYLNSTVILDTGVVTSGNSTAATWEFRGIITVRSTGVSGTVMAQGFYLETAGGTNLFGMVNASPITIDTTITQTINVTVQWGTASASNTITCTNLSLQGWGPPV